MLTQNFIMDQIKRNIGKIIHSWSQKSYNQIKVDRMVGITNETYKLSSNGLLSVIYRKLGKSEKNALLDRATEDVVYEYLSKIGVGPKIFGNLNGVRIQQFIDSTVLQSQSMLDSKYIQKIAYNLYHFHQIKAPISDKRSLFQKIFNDQKQFFLMNCQQKLHKSIYTNEELKIIDKLKLWVLKQEIEFLKPLTKQLEQNLVFSHNDLLANNILIRKQDGKIIFIDFEYCCFNYPIFDISNYFTQSQYDYNVNEYPYYKLKSLKQEKQKGIKYFITCYSLSSICTCKQQYYHYLKTPENWSNKVQEFAEKLQKQYQIGQILSNLIWGWWAIIMSKNQNINFGYLRFAQDRMQCYMRIKQKIINSKT